MNTHAEDLPIEIWFEIFRYLELHDLFHGFKNLNSYFNQILSSNHLSFVLQLRENDNDHFQYSENSYWSDAILNRVIYLRADSQSELDYLPEFLRWYSKKLSRLQSLFIRIYRRHIPFICLALKELNQLEYLSIKCVPNLILLSTILTLPNLRICHLLIRETLGDIDFPTKINSNIKQLSIVFYYNVSHSIINLFLMSTPKLRRLEISGTYNISDNVSLFAEQLFILPEIRILKLQLENGYFISDCFKYLNKIMPSLKYFYFHYYNHYLNEQFINYFMTHWWSIIKRNEQINIYIKGHIRHDGDNEDLEITLKQHKDSLLDENKDMNERVKIEWTEQILTEFKIIEITIVKS